MTQMHHSHTASSGTKKRAEPNPNVFATKAFVNANFTPSTNLGRFEIRYTPGTNELKVVLRFSMYYNSQFYPLVFPSENAAPPQRADAIKREFGTAARNVIPEHWNGRYRLNCTRNGWEKFSSNVVFEVNPNATPQNAHYCIEISDEDYKHYMEHGATDALVSADTWSKSRPQFPIVGGDPLYANMFQHAGVKPSIQAMAGRVIEDLVKGYVLPYPGQYADVQLASFVNQAKAFGSVPVIHLSAAGKDPVGLAAQAEKVMTSAGCVNNIIKFPAGPPTASDAPSSVSAKLRSPSVMGDNVQKHVAPILAEVKDPSIYIFGTKPSFYSQITIVHEFGHMLGLPDEYRCLSDNSRDTLMIIGIIEKQEQAQMWQEVQNKALPCKSKDIKENQQAFVFLCGVAGMAPPLFGRQSNSIMSAGTEFGPHHALTIWEALVKLTKDFLDPADWKIELLKR